MSCTTLRRAAALATVLVLSGGLFAVAASADEPVPPAGTTAPASADPTPTDPPVDPPVEPAPEPPTEPTTDPTPEPDPTPADPAPAEPDPTPADPDPGATPGQGDPQGTDPAGSIPAGDVPAGAWPTVGAEGDPAVDAVADLVIDVEFDDRTYLLDEEVPLTVTVTNTGDAAATAVVGSVYSPFPGPGFYVQSHLWGEFAGFPGSGGTIDAGETVVIELVGSTQREGGRPVVTVSMSAANESDPTDNAETFVLTIQPATVTGDLTGAIFGDLDGDDTYDAGEGLAGVRITLFGGFGTSPTATTDAAGRFRFYYLASRVYSVSFEDVPGGWIVDYVQRLPFDGTNPVTDVVFQAVRPLTDRLEATIAFTADSYRPGDVANLRLTLSNTGTTAIEGIKEGCDRSGGEGPHIELGPEWAELSRNGPGVTLAAGASRTFDLTGTVPQRAVEYGTVVVGCDFGPDGQPIDGFPTVSDYARVPAGVVDTYGWVYHDANGDGVTQPGEEITDTPVGLINPDTGAVVARDVTDAEGRVDFTGLPSGPYLIRVYGPWRFEFEYDSGFRYFGTCGTCGGGWTLHMVPGPDVPEPTTPPTTPPAPTPAPPSTTAPAPQGGATPGGGDGLADTGTSVTELTVVGLLAVALGMATVFLTRRRRGTA